MQHIVNYEEFKNSHKNGELFRFTCIKCNLVFEKKLRKERPFKFLCQKCGREETNLVRYGSANVFSNKDIQSKIRNTNKEKYGVENPAQSIEIKEKIQETNLAKYGNTCTLQNTNIRQKADTTCIERYGTKYVSQCPDISLKMVQSRKLKQSQITDHFKKTCQEKYGVDHPMKLHEVLSKTKKKYLYNNIYFDSSWELAFYIWLTDLKIPFNYHPNIYFNYKYNGTVHRYFPDFQFNCGIVEIKGLQFFQNKNPDLSAANPKDNAKLECMKTNGIIIVTDCSEQLNYIKEKYGKDYLKQFKHSYKQ